MPLSTASSTSNGLTIAPAGSMSMRSLPLDMSFTLRAKSFANSWKISLAGQVLWKRSRCCGRFATAGAPSSAPAVAAPTRNCRLRFLILLPPACRQSLKRLAGSAPVVAFGKVDAELLELAVEVRAFEPRALGHARHAAVLAMQVVLEVSPF